MPTYTYRCADCGRQFDQYQKFSEDPLTDCPTCAGKVRRVIQPVGVVFKGSGWYINDSRGSNSSTPAEKSDNGAKVEAPAAKAEGAEPAAAKTADAAKPAETAKSSDKPAGTSEKKVAASA